MKNSLITSFLALFVLFQLSCDRSGETAEKGATRVIGDIIALLNQEMHHIESFDLIICIPGEGCGGCISRTTGYVYHNIDSLSNVLIVFTGVKDKKLLRTSLGNEFFSRENVFIDWANLFMAQEIASIYPQVFYLEQGKVSKYEELDPDNLSFSENLSRL